MKNEGETREILKSQIAYFLCVVFMFFARCVQINANRITRILITYNENSCTVPTEIQINVYT